MPKIFALASSTPDGIGTAAWPAAPKSPLACLTCYSSMLNLLMLMLMWMRMDAIQIPSRWGGRAKLPAVLAIAGRRRRVVPSPSIVFLFFLFLVKTFCHFSCDGKKKNMAFRSRVRSSSTGHGRGAAKPPAAAVLNAASRRWSSAFGV